MTTLTQRQILAFGEAAESMPTTPLATAVKKLIVERQLLISTMMAAAVEIDEHWAAHCDKEGYGPANLIERLESGIAGDYGYTLAEFKGLKNLISAQTQLLELCSEEIARCNPDSTVLPVLKSNGYGVRQ